MILDKINKPNDIKKINPADYHLLASEIRHFLIEKISKTGGHLSSNLGVVELTMALHLSFNLPKDKIIWDVGHQSYTHKLLTGRKEGFDALRTFGGMSGFPKRIESSCDAFDTGHSSTSVSAGLGIATARDINKQKYKVVSVIGDGSLTGGMAYEAFNNASQVKGNFIIVLNDNEMSIAPNVGAISDILNEFRVSERYNELKEKIARNIQHLPDGDRLARKIKKVKDNLKGKILPGQIINSLGIDYFGPIDGHDIPKMIRTFKMARQIKGPVVVHVLTKKGKGYAHAEDFPDSYHGVSPFDVETGLSVSKSSNLSYAGIFSKKICELAEKNDKIVGITAAMPDGVGLKEFSKRYPERYFDVGIAEAHAVTFAAGMAVTGMLPVFAVYSSFLQRAYDQILHDVCLQELKVIFAIDHAGLVGSDGETHQGIFDLSYLSSIPGMTVLAPKNGRELEDCLEFAVNEAEGPIALRYPSGTASEALSKFHKPVRYGKAETIYKEKDICILAVGRMVETAASVREILKEKGYEVSLVNVRFVKPFDTDLIKKLSKTHYLFVTIEENVARGGFGETVAAFAQGEKDIKHVLPIALPDKYVEHGNVAILWKETGIDVGSIAKKIETYVTDIGDKNE